jgi:hypothetical protein
MEEQRKLISPIYNCSQGIQSSQEEEDEEIHQQEGQHNNTNEHSKTNIKINLDTYNLKSQQKNMIDNLNLICQECNFDFETCQCLPNHDLTNSVCQTCHLQNNKCTSKSNQKDDDTKRSIDKKN